MKYNSLGKKCVLFSFILVISGATMHKIAQAVFSITNVRWYFDERFSDLGQKSIIRYGYDCCHDNFEIFAQQLKKQFPVIKNITVCQSSAGSTMQVSIESVTPKARIDDDWVISQEGIKVRSYFFDNDLVNGLPKIMTKKKKKPCCADKDDLDTQLVTWVTQIPSIILTNYEITWTDQYDIRLHDKQQQAFFVLITDKTEITDALLQAAGKIKSNLHQRGNFLRAVYDWVADLRFKDHIIVFREKRGIKNGENTG